jgi:hypothetical protein
VETEPRERLYVLLGSDWPVCTFHCSNNVSAIVFFVLGDKVHGVSIVPQSARGLAWVGRRHVTTHAERVAAWGEHSPRFTCGLLEHADILAALRIASLHSAVPSVTTTQSSDRSVCGSRETPCAPIFGHWKARRHLARTKVEEGAERKKEGPFN